jgi:hypothetical protein
MDVIFTWTFAGMTFAPVDFLELVVCLSVIGCWLLGMLAACVKGLMFFVGLHDGY